MPRKLVVLFFISLVVAGAGIRLTAADPAPPPKKIAQKNPQPETPLAGMPLPQYDAQGGLLRPSGFERWVVVGTSIGLSYSDGEKKNPDNPGMFHNVYLQPQAFDHFVQTGEFPEQTLFIVTNNPSHATKGKDELNRQGFFAAPSTGLEVAIKDSRRFEDGWAYFMFHDEPNENSPPKSEKPFPRADCYECHIEHGKTDNVFTQFYSVLTTARERHLQQQK